MFLNFSSLDMSVNERSVDTEIPAYGTSVIPTVYIGALRSDFFLCKYSLRSPLDVRVVTLNLEP